MMFSCVRSSCDIDAKESDLTVFGTLQLGHRPAILQARLLANARQRGAHARVAELDRLVPALPSLRAPDGERALIGRTPGTVRERCRRHESVSGSMRTLSSSASSTGFASTR